MWTVRQEKSDLGLHCLSKRLLKQLGRQQKQTIFILIGALMVNILTDNVKLIIHLPVRVLFSCHFLDLR